MANLALFAFTFITITTFSIDVSASTTTMEGNSEHPEPLIDSLINHKGSREQCRPQNPLKELNHCQTHLTHGIMSNNKPKTAVNSLQPMKKQQQHLQLCCAQLKKMSKKCECDAIQQVYDEARKEGGVVEMRQMLSKAQKLPKDCKLKVSECPLVSPRV